VQPSLHTGLAFDGVTVKTLVANVTLISATPPGFFRMTDYVAKQYVTVVTF